jgi:RHS repeat-associated protein
VTDTVARQDLVKDVRFDAVGRITAVKSLIPGSDDYYLEQRAYNARGQLTRIHAGPEQPNAADAWMPVVDLAYHYSNDKNDGKIQRVSDSIAGDDIQYRYDALGRLISAGTVGSGWGLAFEYDDFGNRTAQKVTKGQAPATQTAYDPATNRISDSQTSYDANGNLVRTQDLRLQYDVRNRLTQATHVLNGVEQYAYDPTGNRIWKKSPDGHEQIHLHGFAGRELATYDVRTDVQGNLSLHLVDTNLYFHSRQIRAGGELLVKDRVRSVRARIGEVNGPQAETSSFFPYGEEQQPSDQDRKKFGSYTRDSASGLDYAKHRYYASFVGRFLTPDPAECSAHLADPGRWNKYAFVGNDPVNRVDPRGLQWGSGSSSGGGGGSSSGGGGGSSSGGGGGSSSGGGSGGPCAHQCPEGVRFCDDPCQGGGGSSGGGGGGGGYGSGGSSGGSGGGGSSGGGSSGGNGSGSNGGGGGGGTGDPACLAGCSMVCAGILIGCGLSCNPYRFIPELYVPCMAGCLVIEGICIYGCYRACGY